MPKKMRIEHQQIDGVEHKWCFKCKSWLPLEEKFGKCKIGKDSWDGFARKCLSCAKIYYDSHKDAICKQKQEYRKNNLEKMLEKEREYQLAHQEEYRLRTNAYRQTNGDTVRANARKSWRKRYYGKLIFDIKYMLSASVSARVRNSLKDGKNGTHVFDIIGCSFEDFYTNLEFQFNGEYTWNLYGKGEGKWSIDHKIPVDAFEFESYEDPMLKKCWALDNIRPLWNDQNSSKGKKILPEFEHLV